MGKREAYVEQLKSVEDWESFLKKHSGLPGPRGNLELANAAADCGTARQFREWLKYEPRRAPTNTPGEFVAFCAVLGHGRLLAEGGEQAVTVLRRAASDPRWRVREAAAMGLQRLGKADMGKMLRVVEPWARGTPLEQRAAAAAGCEPGLLRDPKHARRVLHMLDRITLSLARAQDRRTVEFRVLRQGLGYCWSVAVAALPEAGKLMLGKWSESRDADVIWVVRENLGKARLARLDRRWVTALRTRMAAEADGRGARHNAASKA